MNGQEVGKSFNRMERGEHLSDAELKYLRDGLQMLVSFFLETKAFPLHGYYVMQLYVVNSYLENRKVNP